MCSLYFEGMTDTFLTVDEAARRLAITPYTMREWLKTGKVRGVRVSRRWRVPERALFELASATQPPTPPADAANSGDLAEFLAQAQALTHQLEAAGFEGADGAEAVNGGRGERERRLGE